MYSLFCVISFTQHHDFKTLHVVACFAKLFLFITEWYSIDQMFYSLFIYSLIDGYLGCFQFGTITKKVVTNICIQSFHLVKNYLFPFFLNKYLQWSDWVICMVIILQ